MRRDVDNADPGPPPAVRAALGVLVGLAAGALASLVIPAEGHLGRSEAADPGVSRGGGGS